MIAGFCMRVPQAFAYSCGNQSSGHCYAIAGVEADNAPLTYYGAYTELAPAIALRSTGDSNNFITDELWLQQFNTSSNGCPGSYFGTTYKYECWVEVGEMAGTQYYSNGSAYWFWADQRPNYTFALHPYSLVSSGDLGHPAYLEISYSGNGSFGVYAEALSGWPVNRTSTSNSMSANSLSFGIELAGSGGASAPQTSFVQNEYENTSSGWYWLPSGVTSGANNPPYGSYSWNGTGGTMTTSCPC